MYRSSTDNEACTEMDIFLYRNGHVPKWYSSCTEMDMYRTRPYPLQMGVDIYCGTVAAIEVDAVLVLLFCKLLIKKRYFNINHPPIVKEVPRLWTLHSTIVWLVLDVQHDIFYQF